jgi:hypothetical protein
MRRNSLGIWRNIGQIVILLYQIVHEQMKWYIRSFKRDTTKKSNPLNEISKLKKQDIIDRYNEEQESIMRSKRMVELCEEPYYDIKPK